MLLDACSIGNHQSFEQVLSYSMFRGRRHIERMKIALHEQFKASLRVSDGGHQIFKKNGLVRRRSFNVFNRFVSGQRANCA